MPIFNPSSASKLPSQRHRRRTTLVHMAKNKWRAFREAWAAALEVSDAAPSGFTQAHRQPPSQTLESINDQAVSAWLAAQPRERSDSQMPPSRPDPRHTYIQVWQHGEPGLGADLGVASGVQLSTQYVRPRREQLALQQSPPGTDGPAPPPASRADRPRHVPIGIPYPPASPAASGPATAPGQHTHPSETPSRQQRHIPPKLSEVSLPSNFTAPTASSTSNRRPSLGPTTSRHSSGGLYSTGNVFSLAEWDRLPDIRPENRPQSSGSSFAVPVSFILLHPCSVLELDAECRRSVLQIAAEMVHVVESWHTHQTMDLLIRRAGELLRLGPGFGGRDQERWRYCFAAEGEERDQGRQSFESLVRGSQDGGWRWTVYLIEVERDGRGQWSSLRSGS